MSVLLNNKLLVLVNNNNFYLYPISRKIIHGIFTNIYVLDP